MQGVDNSHHRRTLVLFLNTVLSLPPVAMVAHVGEDFVEDGDAVARLAPR